MRAVNIKARLRSAAPTRTKSSRIQELLDIGGFDCEIVISQEADVDFEMVDLDVFDQIYHTMNESKVVLTISFVPLIMFALQILSEGFKK